MFKGQLVVKLRKDCWADMWFWAVISMWTVIKAVGRDDSAQGKQVQSKDGIREESKGHLHVGDRPRKGSHKAT